MPENESGLFRKSTLERVSSPEQLNEYVKVTNPSLIVILIGIFTILTAGVVWIFSSGIPKTASLTGIAVTDSSNVQKVYCYVSIDTSKRLTQGMEAQISPSYAERAQYGFINGKVLSVGTEVITEEYLTHKFENPQLVLPTVSTAMQQGNVVEIEVSMGDWSSEKGEGIVITDGTTCAVSVVTGQTKPYDLIFNK
jgi:hypothetical protein